MPEKSVEPVFPVAAVLDGVDGSGRARVTVDAEGKPSGGSIVSESPANYRFGQAVLNAAMSSRFEAGRPGSYELCRTFSARAAMPAFPDELAEAPPRTDALGDAVMPPKAVRAGVDGEVDVAFELNRFGEVERLISVRGGPAGYSFERAAAASVAVWEFQEYTAGIYKITVRFDHLTSPSIERGAAPPRSMIARPRYPRLALNSERQGVVVFDLAMAEDGLMSAFNVKTEDPEGYGFLEAAAASMRNVVLHPAIPAGSKEFSVVFRLR